MASPSKSAREYCATCGWPLASARCEGCGGDAVPLPLEDGVRKASSAALPDVRLERAQEAFRAGDHARMVSYCLGTEPGWTSRSVTLREGPAWILAVGDALLFLSIDAAAGLLAIESPLVRLPGRQRVPALRLALELCARQEAARICLRNDLLVLRLAERLSLVGPTRLLGALRACAPSSLLAIERLTAELDARPAVAPERRGSAGWDVLGRARALTHLAPPRARPSSPPAEPEVDSTRRADSIPPILAPAFVAGAPTSQPRKLSGQLSSASVSGIMSQRRPTLTDINLDPPSRRSSVTPPPMAAPASPQAERLCELLRQAQALATALSFEEKPATTMLLVRSTVFRAIYAHHEALPDAVAHLYRCTAAATKEIWLSSARRTQSTQIPTAEPALLVMERIVSAQARMPKETPIVLDPLTSAQQAKEHLSRYLAEIECAPPEPNIRHFLALGALTELLVRTKLPAQTQQRVREIIEYAQRDGKKPESTELMMTAITRIAAP